MFFLLPFYFLHLIFTIAVPKKSNIDKNISLNSSWVQKKSIEECPEYIYLNGRESNESILYQASDFIKEENYSIVKSGSDITTKAGKTIVLKKNTKILKGSKYLGRIEECIYEDNTCFSNHLTYDKFFTPNGDGFNDYWQVHGLENQPEVTIFIYDRYGKLLKQLKSSEKGWDGTYNSKKAYSTDYWFKVGYIDCTGTYKELLSHFSLIR